MCSGFFGSGAACLNLIYDVEGIGESLVGEYDLGQGIGCAVDGGVGGAIKGISEVALGVLDARVASKDDEAGDTNAIEVWLVEERGGKMDGWPLQNQGHQLDYADSVGESERPFRVEDQH